jgi:hypothetical protein
MGGEPGELGLHILWDNARGRHKEEEAFSPATPRRVPNTYDPVVRRGWVGMRR